MSLRILVHDVGHGLAIHLFTPNEKTIVVDLGSSDDHSPLAWLQTQTRQIDLLVVTHPHGDHISEITQLRQLKSTVKTFHRPKWLTRKEIEAANQPSKAPLLNEYLSFSDRFSGSTQQHNQVWTPEVSGGVTIQFFFSRNCDRANINNHSIVLVVEYLGVRVLIPGDNEAESWENLLKNPKFCKAAAGAQVFLASHHGRENGYHQPLFELVKPVVCVVSDGRVQSTDARDRYAAHALGWPAWSKSTGTAEIRKSLTTRSDGWIDLTIADGISQLLPLRVECQ